MKTKISLILLISIFAFGFTIEKPLDNDNPPEPKIVEHNIDDLFQLEKMDFGDEQSSFQFTVRYKGPAAHGAPGYIQVRQSIHEFYEEFYGKHPLAAILGDNRARWLMDGSMNRGSVEGSMSKNDSVEPDDGD